MEDSLVFDSNSEEETKIICDKLAVLLADGDVVLITGNLGAGKTFLVKSICFKYGIFDAASPSFSIVNEYNGKMKVFHFDFYRINKVEELYDIGFEEYLNTEDSIIFIEWANLFPHLLPSKRVEINIEMLEENRRKIYFERII